MMGAYGLAMIHTGRCGSSVVGRMLENNDSIEWDGEFFIHFDEGNVNLKRFFKAINPIYMIWIKRIKSNHNFFGFETRPHEAYDLSSRKANMKAEKYIDKLKRMGIKKFIILKRKNYLKQIISGVKARKSNNFYIKDRKERDRIGRKIELNTEKVPMGDKHKNILKRFEEQEEMYCLCNKIIENDKKLNLYYEKDIRENPKIAYEKVCNFIGVTAESVSVDLKKQNPYTARQMVKNWSEVEEKLKDTKYEWMLEK